MKRRIVLTAVCAVVAIGAGAQHARATVPRAITEHISEVTQWAYRGGVTNRYPLCGSTCAELWTAEHAPSERAPFAAELWREIETLREQIEVLPALGSLLNERDLSGTTIGVKMGASPGRLIWLEVALPAASPPAILARGASEPRKYVVNFRNAGTTVGGVRLLKDAWVIDGRYGTVLGEEFQDQCGPGLGLVGYRPPVGAKIMNAYGTAGCAPSFTTSSPIGVYTIPSPVITPSEDYSVQTAATVILHPYYQGDPGQSTVQAEITRQLETHADDYPVLISWLDSHLGGASIDPLNASGLLRGHEPLYKFEAGEEFLPQVAEALTDSYVLDGEGHYALEQANQLNVGGSTLKAAAGSPGTYLLPEALTIELLGARYNDASHEAAESRANINARGNDVSTYSVDEAHMRELGYGEVVYGRVVTDPEDAKVWLQYWVFFYDNSWTAPLTELGQHEGDWEMAQVGLNSVAEPDAMTFARHESSATWGCVWAEVEKTGSGLEEPIVYLGHGSHASYPHAGTTELPWGTTDSHLGEGVSAQPAIHVLSERDDWLNWPGQWGGSTEGLFKSPVTPSYQGEKWTNPSRFQSGHLTPTNCE